MNRKITIKMLAVILLTIILIIISSNISFAGITPDQLTGDDSVELDTDFIDKLTEFIRIVGMFIAVGALMVIGIKYITGSIEEKANYKKSMMPYIIGCFVLFGAAYLAPEIKDLFDNMGSDTAEIGNNILGIIQIVGTLITFGVLMILGIKYMMGSVEEKAEYKRSMLPYIIGVVLLFCAVNITAAIYDVVTESTNFENNNQEIYCTGIYDGHTCHALLGTITEDGQVTFYSNTTITDETGRTKCKTCGSYVSRPNTSY